MPASWLGKLHSLWAGQPHGRPQSLRVFETLEDRRVPAATSFAIIGDYGVNSHEEHKVANLVTGWSPDFIATLGDNNYPSGSASTIDLNIGQYYHEYIGNYTGSYGAGSADNRFFPSLGNHDWMTRSGTPALPTPYLTYFSLPGNERYYTYTQGPIQFFVVDSGDGSGTGSDSFDPDGLTSTSQQGQWLQSSLATSTSPWQVVYFHHPPYSSGSHGNTTVMQWPFQQWGADLVLSGHEHIYERFDINGLPYLVNGLGGASLTSLGPPVSGSQVRYNADYGALRGSANDTTLQLQMVTVAGVVIDTLTLNKGATNTSQLGGVSYLDINGDGQRNAGEPGLRNLTVYLDLNHNGSLDGNEPVSITDANGTFRLGSFPPGNYSIREELHGGQSITGPVAGGFLTVQLAGGIDNLSSSLGHRNNSGVLPLPTAPRLFVPGEPNANTSFMQNLYRSLLARNADSAGLSYWVGQLDRGISRPSVIQAFLTSQEWYGRLVDQYYQIYLGRTADNGGRAYWISRLASGMTAEAFLVNLFISAEATSRYASNESFVLQLYFNLLGRNPSAADLTGWSSAIRSGGMTRAQVLNTILRSNESSGRIVESLYVQFLRRLPDPAGRNYWVSQYASNLVSVTVIASAFVAAPEFFNNCVAAVL